MKRLSSILLTVLLVTLSVPVFAKDNGDDEEDKPDNPLAGIELRSIGPAFMSGRIADIAINPENESQWFVAVGSGGVWKTNNNGVTWDPVFDGEESYSIGCVTIDPSNPSIVWVGTGENVGGRHVGYGDGVYRSLDGGGSWENLGLKESQHISKIVVHPDNSDVVWVAAQGPLWSKGGERGLYMTTDGGANWTKTLGDDEWVGVTDIVIDPRNPDRLYAATWQRHRNVAAYMGGGPGSGIHKSEDGGLTWEKLKGGLPGSNMGKIGLAISPQQPDVVYAAIELKRRTGAVYRSSNRGASWEEMSGEVGGGTGPHYYQELYASPHAFDRIYLASVWMQVSDDGGKNFRPMGEKRKHVDNHSLTFKMSDPNYLLNGCDGGVYESFDLAKNWRFMANLPVTQFYKVALDDAEPFYNIYGGTQDNNTQGGPSRTEWDYGITNADWWVPVGGDGHQPATEPGNPNIMYAESQQGYMNRVDVTTGETVFIQPQPGKDDPFERYNWDTPILVSPHSPTRLYFASYRLWRSDNRGDSWTAISGDLTRNQERLSLPIMDQIWGWDEVWDVRAMSTYNTITSIAESPLQEGLLYVGTDDGLIAITEDGGKSWLKVEVSNLPDVPTTAFVNDIKADLHDANVVYIALDNHKYGDFNPYLFRSENRGVNWKSIAGDLPERTLVWRMVQDHVKPELMFAGTEFGVYATINGGENWNKLAGTPTISFRDLAIQKRENDLVGATFGRGFYVFDDYSFLRDVNAEQLEKEATLFPLRKAWWYIQRDRWISQGATFYTAPNPPFGAVFTYHFKESMKTLEDQRKDREKELKEAEKPIAFPGWDAVEAERRQDDPKVWLTVRDAKGDVVRRVAGKNTKGFTRVAWDLRYPAPDAIGDPGDVDREWKGPMVAPGTYSVTLSKEQDGVVTDLSGPVDFAVEKLWDGTLPAQDPKMVAQFWYDIEVLNRDVSAARTVLDDAVERAEMLQKVLTRTYAAPGALESDLHGLKSALQNLDQRFNGMRAKREIGENREPTFRDHQWVASMAAENTYGPTPMQKQSFELSQSEFKGLKSELRTLVETEMPRIEKALQDAGAPWIVGQPLPE
jgi:hypothetical protein